jgi:hypothetical protein
MRKRQMISDRCGVCGAPVKRNRVLVTIETAMEKTPGEPIHRPAVDGGAPDRPGQTPARQSEDLPRFPLQKVATSRWFSAGGVLPDGLEAIDRP